jgi:hypothetical protein
MIKMALNNVIDKFDNENPYEPRPLNPCHFRSGDNIFCEPVARRDSSYWQQFSNIGNDFCFSNKIKMIESLSESSNNFVDNIFDQIDPYQDQYILRSSAGKYNNINANNYYEETNNLAAATSNQHTLAARDGALSSFWDVLDGVCPTNNHDIFNSVHRDHAERIDQRRMGDTLLKNHFAGSTVNQPSSVVNTDMRNGVPNLYYEQNRTCATTNTGPKGNVYQEINIDIDRLKHQGAESQFRNIHLVETYQRIDVSMDKTDPIPDTIITTSPKLSKAQLSWKRLKAIMEKSRQTQLLLQKWDRRNGLPNSHCSTMMSTNRSRRQLVEERILCKWNGDPLIPTTTDIVNDNRTDQLKPKAKRRRIKK